MDADDTYGELLEGLGEDDAHDDLMADAAEDLELMASEPPDSSTLPESAGEVEARGLVQTSAKTATKARPRHPKKASTAKTKSKPKPKNPTKISQKTTAPKARVQQLKGALNGSRASEPPTPQPEAGTPPPEEEDMLGEEIEEEVDTRLYCVCETLYDDERIMVACDKCDEWYHPSCVGLKEPDVELVDKFFCPKCHQVDPSLVTSYKPVCARPECPHAARPPLSKYCSDECGVDALMTKVDAWGGDAARLLEHPVVANARPREGMLLLPSKGQISSATRKQFEDDRNSNDEIKHQLARLGLELRKISEVRETNEHRLQQLEALDMLLGRARSRVHESDQGLCDFDYRLLMDDDKLEAWLDEGGRHDLYYPEDEDYGVYSAPGNWFCTERRKCPRHAGWEELKEADFELERKGLNQHLSSLSKKERQIRQTMENLESYLLAREIAVAAGKRASSCTEPQ